MRATRLAAATLILALAGCSQTETPEAASGALQADAAQADRDAEAGAAKSLSDATARGSARAEEMMERYEATEKARVEAKPATD